MTWKRAFGLATLLGLVAAGCGWPYPGYDAAHTKYNGAESTLSSANVAHLTERWRAPASTSSDVLSVKGRIYTSVDDASGSRSQLVAYDAAGTIRCSGSPRTCAPLLTFEAPSCAGCLGGFAIANDTVYRWKGDSRVPPAPSSIVAYDATGTKGCNAQTRVCQPIRRYSTGQQGQSISVGTPVVVGDVLYVESIPGNGSAVRLLAFDARGVRSCNGTPLVCTPLWSGIMPTWASPGSVPAVAYGKVFLSTPDSLAAFDAAGRVGCTGTPAVCSPVWVSDGFANGQLSDPSVANGRVYVSDGGTLRVYDAAGVVNCAGSRCAPVWSGEFESTAFGSPLVTASRVFVPGSGTVSVYDRNGCGAALCNPVGSTDFGGRVTGANGLLIVSGGGAGFVRAYRAAAQPGAALWSIVSPPAAESVSEAFVADGTLVETGREPSGVTTLRVFGLPPAR